MSSFNLQDLEGQWEGLYTYPRNDPRGITDGESDFTLHITSEDDNKFHGKGSDAVGSFTFQGRFDESDAKIRFTKSYSTHSWHYSGHVGLTTEAMYGRWGLDQAGGGGYFAFHQVQNPPDDVSAADRLEEISGSWIGTYTTTQTNTTRSCEFELFGEVKEDGSIDQLKVTGAGKASNGSYTVIGVVSPLVQVAFAKIGVHHGVFLYRGKLEEDGRMVGHWAGEGKSGEFDFAK